MGGRERCGVRGTQIVSIYNKVAEDPAGWSTTDSHRLALFTFLVSSGATKPSAKVRISFYTCKQKATKCKEIGEKETFSGLVAGKITGRSAP